VSKNRVMESKMCLQPALKRQKTYNVAIFQNPAPTFLLFFTLSATGTT
jgi:hypothetical protein